MALKSVPIRIRAFCLSSAALLLILTLSNASAAPDLTGVWNCDDKGVYYLKQIGSNIYWYGEQKPNSPHFTNIAYGTFNGDTLTLKWVDVPKGETKANGELILKFSQTPLSSDTTQILTATKKTGNFGGSKWTRYIVG